MDLICPKCSEPFDNEVFHEVAEELGLTYDFVTSQFRSRGCGVAFAGSEYDNKSWCDSHRHQGSPLVGAVYDLLGDDMDGAAAMLEDADLAGLLD